MKWLYGLFFGLAAGILVPYFAAQPAHAQTLSAPPAPAPAAAPAPAPELTKLQTTLTNMGYDAKIGSDGVTLTVSTGKYYVNIVLSGDKTVVYAQIAYTIKPEQKARIPWQDALHFNDTHQEYMAVSKADDVISMNVNFPFEVATPKVLQSKLQILQSGADDFSAILNPDNWK